MLEGIIKRLVASIKCGVCQNNYEEDNISILGQRQDLWYLRVFCSACHTHALMAVVVREDNDDEVVTDLTDAELDRFKTEEAVTEDDVIEVHKFLRDFDGDVSQLLGRESDSS